MNMNAKDDTHVRYYVSHIYVYINGSKQNAPVNDHIACDRC